MTPEVKIANGHGDNSPFSLEYKHRPNTSTIEESRCRFTCHVYGTGICHCPVLFNPLFPLPEPSPPLFALACRPLLLVPSFFLPDSVLRWTRSGRERAEWTRADARPPKGDGASHLGKRSVQEESDRRVRVRQGKPRETPHSLSASTTRHESVLPGLLGRSPGRSALHVVGSGADATQARSRRASRVPPAAVHGSAYACEPPWRQYAPTAWGRWPWIAWIYVTRWPTTTSAPATHIFVGWPVRVCSVAASPADWFDFASPSRPPISWPWKTICEWRHGCLRWHVVWR